MPTLLTPPATRLLTPQRLRPHDLDRSIDDTTRRDLFLLAGCGRTDAPQPTAAMRQFTDSTGSSVSIPVEPRRVVAADNVTLPRMLDLGLIPIAAGSTGAEFNGGREFNGDLYPLGAGGRRGVLPQRTEPRADRVASA